MLKCPSCKYECRTFTFDYERVIRYKSGKNKGEVKEVKKETKEFFPEDPEFITLYYYKEVDELMFKDGCMEERATLKACPMCGTVIVKEINEAYA